MNRFRIALAAAALLFAATAAFWRYGAVDHYDYAAAFETAAAAGAAPVSLAGIAGQSPEAVQQRLGQAQSCEQGEFSRRCRYPGPGLQVVYIGNRADWITVSLADRELSDEAAALKLLGLPLRDPDERDRNSSTWRNFAGYRELRIVSGEEGVLYARFKHVTP